MTSFWSWNPVAKKKQNLIIIGKITKAKLKTIQPWKKSIRSVFVM